MSPRLLLLSYHFGPGCETGGFRWNAIAGYLAGAGWHVDVLTAARPGADRPYSFQPGVDVLPVQAPDWVDSGVQAVGRLRRRVARTSRRGGPTGPAAGPAGADVALPTRHPGVARHVYGRLMANLDAVSRWSSEVGWSRRAALRGMELARQQVPAVIVSTTPPHPAQLAGVQLARALRRPLVADFRDPWLFGELDGGQSTVVDLRLGAWAQARTFAAATTAVFNTTWAQAAAVERDPSLAPRSTTIPNGYDPRPGIGRPDLECFRVAFVGWLYPFMDPEPLLAACGRLRAREALESLRVEFVGSDPAPGGVSLVARAKAHGLEGCFDLRPRVPRGEAQATQERAAVQVVFDYPGPYRVPMKFYDAAQGYGDLLLIGAPRSALGDAAARIGVTVVSPDDPEAIDAVLQRALQRWRRGAYDEPRDVGGLFARERTCRPMLALLQSLADQPTR